MANLKNLNNFLFLLAFVACMQIQFTEERQLKAVKEHEFGSVQIETGLHIPVRKAINFEMKPESRKDDLEVSIGQKQILPPMPPTENHELSSSEVSHSNGVLQSTAPGNSPGVGHSLAGQKDNMHTKTQDFTSTSAQTDDFKGPGHSPGVGHYFGDFKKGPNA